MSRWLAATAIIDASEDVHPLSLVWTAFPASPSWGLGTGDPYFGVATEEMADVGSVVPNCESSLDDGAMAACLSDLYGGQLSAADVAACRSTLGEAPVGDDLEASWELEGCILDALYPPTPRDLFLEELVTCPGGANPDAADATPEEQQALIECGRSMFEDVVDQTIVINDGE